MFLALLLSAGAWAARNAYVKSDRAYIYADVEKTAPIGFARRGKKIRVGDVIKKEEMLAVIVSGKVAYIKSSDITFDEDSLKEKQTKKSSKKEK